MAERDFSVLILAAGKATRFKSERPKVLHRLAGKPLGEYALRAALATRPQNVYMIVGHEAEQVSLEFAQPGLTFIEQKQQLGTGHALVIARHELEECTSSALIVLVGDAPLLRPQTLLALTEEHAKSGAAATILSTTVENPTGYGRIIRHGGKGASAGNVEAIVEEKVATPAQRKVNEVSSGIICFSRTELLAHVGELSADNAQKEYLLTDLVGIFHQHGKKVGALPVEDSSEVLGVNDRLELARVEKRIRLEKIAALARSGVTVVDPDNTYIDDDVEVGRDTTIDPGVSLLGLTRVGSGCVLRPYSTITDSVIGDRVTVRPCSVISESQIASDATIGPFAHLRDGAVIEPEARIGNFVEVKKSRVGAGSKASHLAYLGDASIGERVNIGAGTVTCNYDGEKKHPTTIESGSFIGSGSMLVAPVRIGRGSLVAAGSAITQDVPPESLALGRAQQINKEGWVRIHRGGQKIAGFGKRKVDDVTVVDVTGRLTMGEPVNSLGRTIEQLASAGTRKVVINLGKVEYIDSSGMGVLVHGITRLRAVKGELKLCEVPQHVMYILQVGNLDRAFEIFPQEAKAVESFKAASA